MGYGPFSRILEEMFADYDSRNPCEDNLPDYFDDDEDDEEPQDQSWGYCQNH